MVIDHTRKHRQMAARGKYQRLYSHLCSLPDPEWKVSFADIEVLGFELPDSARLYRPWWANQAGGGRSQAIAWMAAGWEAVLGFELPDSARLYRPWWANQAGGGRSQAIAWMAAGWETAKVDIPGETLLFRRRKTATKRKPSLDEVWPVHSAGGWPQCLSLDRAEIYEGRT